MVFQVEIGLFRSSVAHWDFKYFSILQHLEVDKNIPNCDLEIYINHLEK